MGKWFDGFFGFSTAWCHVGVVEFSYSMMSQEACEHMASLCPSPISRLPSFAEHNVGCTMDVPYVSSVFLSDMEAFELMQVLLGHNKRPEPQGGVPFVSQARPNSFTRNTAITLTTLTL